MSSDLAPDILDPAASRPASGSVLGDWLAFQRAFGLQLQTAAALLRNHRHPAPALAAAGPGVRLGACLGADLNDAMSHAVFDAVPLAGGARGEDHVRAVAALNDVADERPLIGLHEPTVPVERRDDRNREAGARAAVLDAPHRFRATLPVPALAKTATTPS